MWTNKALKLVDTAAFNSFTKLKRRSISATIRVCAAKLLEVSISDGSSSQRV